MSTILLIGSGAREHAIARAIHKSPRTSWICCYAAARNPGIHALSTSYEIGDITDPKGVVQFGMQCGANLAVIGPEAPLENGVADALWKSGIPCVGPKKALARIETSKGFTRRLLDSRGISVNPAFKAFETLAGAEDFLAHLGDAYVVKYDGLMGGKGVKVAGDHLHSHAEALEYCADLVKSGGGFLIEEKLTGQEFSLMSFCDGTTIVHAPPVQDHKRAFVGDSGSNTGGMGSYSDANHSLPFLSATDIQEAEKINAQAVEVLNQECGQPYRGILYGGFMATADGIRLVEYNARLGDPEAMNILTLLESDFVALCEAIASGTLAQVDVSFSSSATVCKYAVPNGYPDSPVKGEKVDLSDISNPDLIYYGAVDERDDGLYETGSRSLAVAASAPTLAKAESIVEEELSRIKGPLFHREDIGTAALIESYVADMHRIRGQT